MKVEHWLLAVLLASTGPATYGTSIVDANRHDVEWEIQTYRAHLPEPFRELIVTVTHALGSGGDVRTIEVSFGGKAQVLVDPKIISKLALWGSPNVSFSSAALDEAGNLSEFTISFEYGGLEFLDVDVDTTCQADSTDSRRIWMRRSAFMTIDRAGHVSIALSDLHGKRTPYVE